MKYVCEFCNKSFNTRDEAVVCESSHEADKQKALSERAISNAVNAYISEYGEAPYIKLSDENKSLLNANFFSGIDSLLECFLDLPRRSN